MLRVSLKNLSIQNVINFPSKEQLMCQISIGSNIFEPSSVMEDSHGLTFVEVIEMELDAADYENTKMSVKLLKTNNSNNDDDDGHGPRVCLFSGLSYIKDILSLELWNQNVSNITIPIYDHHSSTNEMESFSILPKGMLVFDGRIEVSQGLDPDLEQLNGDEQKDSIDDEIEPIDQVKEKNRIVTNSNIIINSNSNLSPFEIFRDLLYNSTMTSDKSEYILQSLDQSNGHSIIVNGNETPSRFRLDDEDIRILSYSLFQSAIPLETLVLKYNRITDIGVKHIGFYLIKQDSENFDQDNHTKEKVKRVISLSYLDLEGNDIKNIEYLKLHKSKMNELKYLNISSNSLGESGGLKLAESLIKNRRLKTLIMNNCGFPLKAMISIITSISGNRILEEIEMDRSLTQSNTITEELSDHFSRILLERSLALTKLSLRWNGIQDHGCELLATSLSRNHRVSYVNLESNSIGVAGAEALASTIILQQRQRINDENMLYSANNRNYIEVLKLSYNIIGDEGAIALAEAMEKSTSLTKVTLNNNGIGARGLIAIGESLKRSTSIQSISLFGNHFEQRSGELFYTLVKEILPEKGIIIDIDVYIVDGIYMIAEAK